MNRLVLFILLFLFWCLLTVTAFPPGSSYLQDIGVGLAMALLVTWMMGTAVGKGGLIRWLQPSRYFWGLVYLVVLAGYVVAGNFDVAYRGLHPRLPIRPGIVRVKTRLKKPAARTMLGNSITLCPGTMTVDIWQDGTMMVHWINVRSLDEHEATQKIIGRFEWFLEKIFQ